ncbi:MAG: DUF2828 family protein [Acetatifactor sp.]|nr:DUF2828 family protein [Acetatifactor sp.]
MSFADVLRKAGNFTHTENGAVALNTTRDARLDFFSTVGSLREADENRICTLFAQSYGQDALFTMKILFYARDIRGGLGERETFRTLLRYAADHHPEAVKPNLDLVGVFGRYDDLYTLIGTRLEEDMWAAMKGQFEEDLENLRQGNAVSLLAKWIKTADSSSAETRRLGILTAQKLGYSVYEFKRLVRSMRKRIGIVEALMAAGRWDEITYGKVPSRAMKVYRKAFQRHDPEGFSAYLGSVEKGEAKIHADALYPYDIVREYMYGQSEDRTLEAQWRALPNYVKEGSNVLVMADTSGSMTCAGGRPLASSVGLAIYFAERNTGAYHNMFMTFSEKPSIIELQGETLYQKVRNTMKAPWGMNTNLQAAFERVLDIAVGARVPQEEMPKAIVVISDMEIDHCGDKEWSFYDNMADRFRRAGYQIPNIIFWNVNSRHDIFHADKSRRGVQLASGQSVTVFKQILESLDCTPVEAMERTIGAERYECISIG